MEPAEQRYDFAFSFAGEQRDYVRRVKQECEELGLSVFFDENLGNSWWGRSVVEEQRVVYSSQSTWFVPFISTEYLAKPIPRDEYRSALERSIRQNDPYILPVTIGDPDIPAEVLHPHIRYLRSEDFTESSLAAQMLGKRESYLGRETGGAGGESAPKYRLPKTTPDDFSIYEEIDNLLAFLAASLEERVQGLSTTGYRGNVTKSEGGIAVRVERRGSVIYYLDIKQGGFLNDQQITFGTGRGAPNVSSGINGWAEPVYDVEEQRVKVKAFNLSFIRTTTPANEFICSKEELLDALWDGTVEAIEQHAQQEQGRLR